MSFVLIYFASLSHLHVKLKTCHKCIFFPFLWRPELDDRLNLMQILTNTSDHNADKALHREGYNTLWTNYQYIANKHGCLDPLHYFELFVVVFFLKSLFYVASTPIERFVNVPLRCPYYRSAFELSVDICLLSERKEECSALTRSFSCHSFHVKVIYSMLK